MTATDTKRIERITRESTDLARKSLKKSSELEAYLSVMEYRAGKIRRHKSVRDLFRKLKSYVRYLLYERLIVRFENNYDNPSDIPEDCLLKLPIPSYIDTILDLGCGNGRNLVPFDGKLKLWATDIVRESGSHSSGILRTSPTSSAPLRSWQRGLRRNPSTFQRHSCSLLAR